MPDIRISSTFYNHRKTLHLIRECGYKGAFCLIRLWNYVAEHYPDGSIPSMNVEEIEIVSGWIVFADGQVFGGDPGKFFEVISSEKSRFIDIDKDYNIIMIHGWDEHQPWIINSKIRSQKAKEAAKARWNRFSQDKQNQDDTCNSNANALHEHKEDDAKGNARSNARTVPYRIVSNKLEGDRAREDDDWDYSLFEEPDLVKKVYRSSQPRNLNQFFDAVTRCQEKFPRLVWKSAFEKFTLTAKPYSMKALVDFCEEEAKRMGEAKVDKTDARLEYLVTEVSKRLPDNPIKSNLISGLKRLGATDQEIIVILQKKLIQVQTDDG